MYNLAGSARNNPDGTVKLTLQGDKDRIDQTLAAIRSGSKKSSKDNTISEAQSAWNPNLKTFTVFGWTSTSRNIANPYDLVFFPAARQRPDIASRRQGGLEQYREKRPQGRRSGQILEASG